MKEPVIRFLQAARSAGMRISVAESIDAFRALDLVGFVDRGIVKDTLALVLAKSADEKQLLDECFESYFNRREFANLPADAAPAAVAEAEAPLGRMLLGSDRAGLAAALEAAAEAAGVGNIRFFTQTNLYVRRVMERMGLEALEREIARLEGDGTAEAAAQAERLALGRAYLRDEVRDYVERQLAVLARGANEELRDTFLKTARLSNLDRRDFERMRVIVRTMAKRLATRYGRVRRRPRRGQLDLRRTLRRNMAHDGVPFVTHWKSRKIDKPRVFVLCDVSGSVAAAAQFLLLFLYSLNEALSDIRAFAFSNSLVEVSHVLEHETIEDAIAKIMKEVGFGASDYGRVLADFEAGWLSALDRKTSVIIMGDARSNFTAPRADILRKIYERAKRVIWLNPESAAAWGSGDSEMLRYRSYCHVARVCNNVRHLEWTLTDLLKRAS